VGIHVACSIYGMLEGSLPDNIQDRNLARMEQSLSLTDRVKWLGKCYAYGATANKDDIEAATKIKKLNAQIFLIAQTMHQKETVGFVPQVDYQRFVVEEVYPHDMIYAYYVTGRRWTLEYFEQIYHRLGTSSKRAGALGAFDHYYFESAVAEYGYTTVQKYLQSGLFEVGEGGAIVSSKEKNGLHTRVFINALGLPTYEAKELGLNPQKRVTYPFDQSFIITANEINEYFKVLLWNLKQIDPYVGEHTTHIGHGVVRLPEGKMSSRTGKILSGESLIEEAKGRILEKMSTSTRDTGSGIAPDHSIAEKIAIAAVKYSLLKTNIGKDVVFDFEESLSFEGNSGPYLLYTIVRCRSILEKSKVTIQQSTKSDSDISSSDALRSASTPYSSNDLALLRWLVRSPAVYALATRTIAPHTVCTYLYTLASVFSSYYAKVNILKTEDPTLRETRLRLVSQVADTLIRGCHLLGFETVEKMKNCSVYKIQ
jgi:arginyl-tRNA synthetase